MSAKLTDQMGSELNGFIAQLLHRACVISRCSLGHYLLLDLVVDVRDGESVAGISGVLVELAVDHALRRFVSERIHHCAPIEIIDW